MNKIEVIKQFNSETGIGLKMSKQCLEYADYDFILARQIAEYYGLAVKKNYTVGKVIRDYWIQKENLKHKNN